jgi:hypothetical protein
MPDGFRVAATQCESCIFGPNSAIKDRPERMRDLAASWRANDTFQICHAFGVGDFDDDGNEMLDGEEVVCRGFYDTQPPCQMQRIAERLQAITGTQIIHFVPLPVVE